MRIFFLVFRLNLVRIILGWDGLGLISYILVVFYKNEKSRRAGIITALSNRVGDAALLIRVSFFLEIGRWNYIYISYRGERLIYWLIRLASITKRAQIPFSAWLPAAIAAPAPVSALVHSSTLVTAGVYLLIRFRDLIKDLILINLLIYLGLLTTVIARLRALFEVDFKKVVALSTLRQLGVIVITISFGLTKLAFIHILTHAIFKALLFICRGKVIHSISNYQDIRKIGGLVFNLPITRVIINLSRFALCGVPFLRGFYSKDLIIERVIILDNFFVNYCAYIVVVGLSSSYSFRLIYLRIVNNINQLSCRVRDERDWIILGSKLGLLVITLIRGSFLLWLILSTPSMNRLLIRIKLLSLYRIFAGTLIGVIMCFLNFKGLILVYNLSSAVIITILWNLPILSGSFTGLARKVVNKEFKRLDLGWNEIFGGQGFNYIALKGREILIIWLKNSVKVTLVIFILRFLILAF